MASLIKSLARTAALNVGFTRTAFLRREFLRSTPSCRGIYASFAAAAADAPSAKLASYDQDEIALSYRERLDYFNFADYPVIFWLGSLLDRARVIFELGGSIGLGYYAYVRYLAFPPDLRWTVCELPSMVRMGIDVAAERQTGQLAFTTDRQPEIDPDVYATFGTLQYIEEPFAEILSSLRALPPYLLINRVPLTEGKPFITLQNNGTWFSPNKVDNRKKFTESLCALGYEVVDEWDMERPNAFFMEQEGPMPSYCGLYLRRR
jgi:putative methyltransferase (TIGR04325 family)